MEIEWENPIMWGIVVIFYLLILAMIWKIPAMLGGEWAFNQKIIMTIASAPVIFLAVNFQLNRG